MKIAAGLISFVLLAIVGTVVFFFLLLSLNGFSERDANPALGFYIVWSIIVAALFGAGAFFLAKLLIAKSFHDLLALVLSIAAAVGIGAALDFGGMIAAALVASEVKSSHMKK